MKSLGREAKFRKLSRQARPYIKDGLIQREPRQGFLDDTYALVAPIALKMMCGLANLPSLELSAEQIRTFQASFPFRSELSEISDVELLELCDQLRIVWDALAAPIKKSARIAETDYSAKAQAILHAWWNYYPDLKDSKRWRIFYETGTFFPTEMNWRALMARILFDNRHHLMTCVNCERRFIKRVYTSKYCKDPMCKRKETNERQIRHQANKKGRVSRPI